MSLAKLREACEQHAEDYVSLPAAEMREAAREAHGETAIELFKLLASTPPDKKVSVHRTAHAAKLLGVAKPEIVSPSSSPIES